MTRSATIFPLAPGTSYHYRLIAEDPWSNRSPAKGTSSPPFTPLPSGLDGPCANAALRTEAAAFLADCRAYEMVSPLDKNNGDLMSPKEGSTNRRAALNESSPSGQRLTYSAYRAFGDAKSSPFSADLCNAWIRTVADPVLAPGAIARFPNLYRRQDDECGGPGYEALTTVEPSHETPEAPCPCPGRQYVGLELQGLSEDGAEAIFVVAENLTEDAPPQPAACINDLREADKCELRLYERSADGALHYPCVLPNGVVSNEPCAAGWPNDDSGKMRLGRVDNAISADGSRVFWTSYSGTPRNGAGKIYVRENASQPRSEECADASKACTIAVSQKAEEESGTSASRYWAAARIPVWRTRSMRRGRSLPTASASTSPAAMRSPRAIPTGAKTSISGRRGARGAVRPQTPASPRPRADASA